MKNKSDKRPIGIFDSGLGGLNVVKEIINLLPYENIVYLGDTARLPYGNKTKETIIRYSIENTKFLLSKNIKLLVIACNTSSSYAVPYIRKIYKDLKIVEVITPGARSAISLTKNYKIGVIGTKATIRSNSYTIAVKKICKHAKVYSQATPLFVPLIEEGWIDKLNKKSNYRVNHSYILKLLATEYLKPLKQKNVDVLILGCTHYPAIKSVIQEVMGKNVAIVDSSKEVAKVVKELLEKENMLNTNCKLPKYEFFATDDPEGFKKIGSLLLERKIVNVKKINLEQLEKGV